MMFYQVECKVSFEIPEEKDDSPFGNDRKPFGGNVRIWSNEMFARYGQQSFVFFDHLDFEQVVLGVITKVTAGVEEHLRRLTEEFLSGLKFTVEETQVREITLCDMCQMLRNADRKDYIDDDDRVLGRFRLLNPRRHDIRMSDELQTLRLSRGEIKATAAKYLLDQTLVPELERIAAGTKKANAAGHPVHYIVLSDDPELRSRATELLHLALWSAGRIVSRRISRISSFGDESPLDAAYRSCAGGMLAVDLAETDDCGRETLHVRTGNDIRALCNAAKKHRSSTLSVFCLPKSKRRLREELLESLGNLPVVEITENDITPDNARDYLQRRAKEHGVKGDVSLYSVIGTEAALTVTDLDRHFDDWYSLKLRRSVYPQYAEVKNADLAGKDAASPRGSAASELERMVGLDEAKRVIGRAVDYYKAQRLFADKGIKQKTPSMHMVFTGNPGTAKTTVARLFAQIMKDNGLLSDGELLEVGRADLVGKYVGWTATLVKSAFKRARGGVLFIDEAYSLLDDKEGMYGDEAINTIVQEMENNREDVVVIFAGYPDKMEAFLQRNPGLRSRIAFHVPFEDYSADQLCDIAAFMAAEQGMVYPEETRLKLHDIFENAARTEGFGNGRFVRNVIEQARMEQAGRLVRMNYEDVTMGDIATLLPEDIVPPPAFCDEQSGRLGF